MSSHNAIASSSAQPSTHKTKKSKRDKSSHSHKHHHKSKHDSTSTKVDGTTDSNSKSNLGPYEQHHSTMRLSIPPKFARDWLGGAREVLDGMIMRYVPQMNGVLLAHWDHEFAENTLKIINECPFGVCMVHFRSIIWAPKIGQRLCGTHSLSSPSHISLLFSKTFNISIPLQHIPLDQYEFEATDDVEKEDEESDSEDGDDDGEKMNGEVHEVGRWKRKKDGKFLGEGGKGVKFTVIGMQVTNQMLSLTGSLLSDPTNPPAPPEPTIPIRPTSPSPSLESEQYVEIETEAIDQGEEAPQPKKYRPYPTTNINTNTYIGANVNAQPKPRSPANGITQPQTQTHTEPEALIDERYLSARELKQRRKEEERRKKDMRKARKADPVGTGPVLDVGRGNGDGDVMGGERMEAGEAEVEGRKRKIEGVGAGTDGERKKKKKEKRDRV